MITFRIKKTKNRNKIKSCCKNRIRKNYIKTYKEGCLKNNLSFR